MSNFTLKSRKRIEKDRAEAEEVRGIAEKIRSDLPLITGFVITCNMYQDCASKMEKMGYDIVEMVFKTIGREEDMPKLVDDDIKK